MASSLDPKDAARFVDNLEETSRFFMGEGKVHETLYALARALEAAHIPYAIAGAMALNAHGYVRATTDVDVLLTREGLEAFKQHYLGRGYLEKFPGSKAVRDTQQGVTIDFLITGDYPGDGKPKPIQFPDPGVTAMRGELHGKTFAVLPVTKMLELKLASGITARHRLKDLADVQEWIKHAKLARELSEQLDPYVRDKYLELWDDAQIPDIYNP